MANGGGQWLPSGGGLAGFLAATILAIFVGVPFLGIMAMGGGGCEARLETCEPDNTALYVAAALALGICIGFGLIVKKLVNRYVHGRRS